jgi:hypothetical protein
MSLTKQNTAFIQILVHVVELGATPYSLACTWQDSVPLYTGQTRLNPLPRFMQVERSIHRLDDDETHGFCTNKGKGRKQSAEKFRVDLSTAAACTTLYRTQHTENESRIWHGDETAEMQWNNRLTIQPRLSGCVNVHSDVPIHNSRWSSPAVRRSSSSFVRKVT